MESFGLMHGIATGACIDHQQGLVRSALVLFAQGAPDLAQFLHQVVAGVETACGVAYQEFGALGDGLLVGVETNRGGVGVGVAADHRDVEALAPTLKLFDRGCAEGIGSHQKNTVALALEPFSEFGAGSGLAGSVHTDHQNNEGHAVLAGCEGGKVGRKFECDVLAGAFHHIFGVNFTAELLQIIDDFHAHPHAQIGRNEISFEFVPVDLGTIGDFVVEGFEEASHGIAFGYECAGSKKQYDLRVEFKIRSFSRASILAMLACPVGFLDMAIIRVLPDTLASQVAAGEVIERPASVVKELVENSIDAGAREVRVEIKGGGVSLIRVEDDGSGMSRDDALLSLERHATSKLRVAGDLAAIKTLGFRGEAVPSIASVAKFRMVTRQADAMAGTEILVDGGKLRDVRDAGCAPGTIIEARSLFYNLPARRKFLRAESTESAQVEHQMRLHALAAPWMRLRLRRNDKQVLDLAGVEKCIDRVRQLLGPQLAGELLALPPHEARGIQVEGFVLPAKHARKGRRHQCVFLNGRPVEDAGISRALAEGFRGQLADSLHPAAWLWIEMDPALVDVNVHPAKREVRLHQPESLRQVIMEAVVDGLKSAQVSLTKPSPLANTPADPDAHTPSANVPISREFGAVVRSPQAELSGWGQVVEPGSPGHESQASWDVPNFRAIGVLHQRYVLMESEDALVILDPRAAWERVWYEKLMLEDEQLSQGLLMPLLLELDPRDAEVLVREREALARAGIELDDFGGNTLQVSALPACLDLDDPRSFMMGVIDTLLHDSVQGAKRFARERMARLCARQAALRVGARLSEVPDLLKALFACDMPYATAAGKPTISEWSLSELERRFS